MRKLLPNRKRSKPQIVVTNLIDIILLLVFFFMITSSFAHNNQKLPVNVPRAANATTMETDNMTVQITHERKLFVAGNECDQAALTEQIKTWVSQSPDRPVMVEADEKSNYGFVVNILDTIRQAGAINIGLATKPEMK